LIYDPLIYLLMGTGLVWVVALSWQQNRRNTLCICEWCNVNLTENQTLTYR
jgi:hypothetical protein